MVCIAALVVIVVIGVYRIHATHQEETRDDEDEAKEPEEDWENSALSITVNPMEVCVLFWRYRKIRAEGRRFDCLCDLDQ